MYSYSNIPVTPVVEMKLLVLKLQARHSPTSAKDGLLVQLQLLGLQYCHSHNHRKGSLLLKVL